MNLYFGINIGKFFHVACFLDDGGNQIDQLKFNSSYQGFTELEKLTQEFSIPNDDTLLGMKATGHYWFPLYEFLTDKGY